MKNLLYITRRRATLAVLVSSTIAAMPAAGQSIHEDYKLTANDAAPDDRFGTSVAISGENAIVGAPQNDEMGSNAGAAYLFDSTTGEQLLQLIAPDGEFGDNFGSSVGISGTTAIVGAYFDDNATGSAYVFDVTSGLMLNKVIASDRAQGDFFGASVGISGTTAIVGAYFDDDAGMDSGSAYLFDTTTGEQLFKLTASDGAAGDRFGNAVAISGTIAIVGAQSAFHAGVQSGVAYLFDTTTGQQLFKLTTPFGINGDLFGFSVAISGNIAIVGSIFDHSVGFHSGLAFLFDVTTGEQLFTLAPGDASAQDRFGYSVGISGTRAIVGALFGESDSQIDTGSAYVFDTTTGKQILRLTSSDAASIDEFGVSVAISGEKAIVGAVGDDDAGNLSGSAYLFTTGDSCPADLTGDGMLNFFDVSAFLSAFAAGDPLADFTGDGKFNFFDVSAFLTAFAAGCP